MIKNNRGIVFITALAVMVILLTLATGYLFISRTQLDIGSNQGDALKAFYIAHAGIEKAIRELIIDSSWNVGFNNVSFGGGSYTVTRSGNEVTSVGTYNGASRTIVAGLGISYNSDFDFASHAGDSIAFDKNTSGNIRKGNAYGDKKADLGKISFDEGYGSTENENREIPYVSASDYNKYKADALAANPDQVKDSNFDFIAADSPYEGLWFIDGQAAIESGVTINGTVIAHGASGNINIANKASDITITPTGNYPALIAENQIDMSNTSNITITGLIYGEKDLDLNSSSNFKLKEGAIVVKGNIQGNAQTSVDIEYSSDFIPPYFTIGEGADARSTSVAVTVTTTSWKGHPD